MCRPRSLSAVQERRIGLGVALARAEGVCWKLLMRRYGLGRTKLYELWRAELDRSLSRSAPRPEPVEGPASSPNKVLSRSAVPASSPLDGEKDVREHLGAGQGQRTEDRSQGTFDRLRIRSTA